MILHYNLVKWWGRHADIEKANNDGHTPLLAACQEGRTAVVWLLAEVA